MRVVDTGSVTVGTTPTEIRPARSNRSIIWIYNFGSVEVFVGNSDVTAADGYPIAPSGTHRLHVDTAVYAITVTDPGAVRYSDESF